ncbi:hypothetical protein [Solidesulfovibrio sp. C21]|uniref:hypothetical protein n=1 Tax=Solidesulfovibrio sp. C21 TaxID=3398613 RepID=UPI0039FC61FD
MLGQDSKLRLFALVALLVACFFGATRFYADFSNSVLCTLIAPFRSQTTGKIRFLSCSNVLQTVTLPDAAAVRDMPEPGTPWSFFTSAADRRTEVRVTVKKDRDTVIFYPRVSGKDSAVTVYAEDGPYRRRLFALHGTDGKWTEMGQQFILDLRCAPYGYSPKEFDEHFLIVLTGKWSQLWHLGPAVFF